MSTKHDAQPGKAPETGRRAELFVFAVIAAFIWPVVAVGVVGGYGFLVWMSQIILGPPGPPGASPGSGSPYYCCSSNALNSASAE